MNQSLMDDIRGLKTLVKSDDYSAKDCFMMMIICVMSTLLSFVWRPLMCVGMFVVWIIKIFKPRRHMMGYMVERKRQYKTCPKCGRELTYYNHGIYENGICYEFCECGYDSRNAEEEE